MVISRASFSNLGTQSVDTILSSLPKHRNSKKSKKHGSEASSDDDAVVLDSSNNTDLSNIPTDKRSRDYMSFIASSAAQKDSDPDSFANKVAKLTSEISEAFGLDSNDISELDVSASTESTSASAVSLQASDSSFSLDAAAYQSVSGHLSAHIQSADGSDITIEADYQTETFVQFSLRQNQQQATQQQCDPLALDIDGDGQISLSNVQNGATFDINADNQLDKTSFVTGNDVFLAWDRNQDGTINNGSELFGDQNGSANGYIELAKYDEDQNNVIDANDSIFSSLKGIRLGENGQMETQDLLSLGVKSIGLGYQNTNQVAQNDNTIGQIGSYQKTDGSSMLSADILLNYQSVKIAA